MKMNKKLKKGFTLVELVVVIAVIAILAGVSVGAYFGITESAKNSKADQEAKAIHTSVMLIVNDPTYENIGIKDGKITGTEANLLTALNAVTGLTYDNDYNPAPNATNSFTNIDGYVDLSTDQDKIYYVSTDNEVREITVQTGEIKEATWAGATAA